MKNRNMIILIILIILVLLSFNLFSKSLKNRNNTLNDTNNQNSVRRKQFSMYVENVSGEYVEYNSSELFPTGYKLNLDKSTCVDINGLEVPNVLSGSGNAVTVTSNKTVFCYIYFDMVYSLAKYIKDNPTSGFNTSIEAGLYRYQGTNDVVTNNYVCFGTTDKDTCLNDTDKYMYRIIGIDENNQIKLIKKTSIGSYMWHSDNTTNISWPESDLYKGLNGIDGGYYTDLFVNSSTYDYMNENSNWYNKIVNYEWKYGDTSSYGNYNGVTMYAIENGWTNTVTAKVGIWYIHDYYYAYGVGGNPEKASNAKKAWISWGEVDVWFLSRYGYYNDSYYNAWRGDIDGWVVDYGSNALSIEHMIRPVFYLTSDVEYSSGTGTLDDPFLISA